MIGVGSLSSEAPGSEQHDGLLPRSLCDLEDSRRAKGGLREEIYTQREVGT